MKKLLYLTIALAVVLSIASAQDEPWFDPKNCAFCKLLADQPDLLMHINTEYHNIDGGYLQITQIDKAYQGEFMKAQAGMEKLVADMQATGNIPTMCRHCSTYGAFLITGVRNQYIHSAFGEIVMMTSPDTSMVEKLQAFAARSAVETEKYKKELDTK